MAGNTYFRNAVKATHTQDSPDASMGGLVTSTRGRMSVVNAVPRQWGFLAHADTGPLPSTLRAQLDMFRQLWGGTEDDALDTVSMLVQTARNGAGADNVRTTLVCAHRRRQPVIHRAMSPSSTVHVCASPLQINLQPWISTVLSASHSWTWRPSVPTRSTSERLPTSTRPTSPLGQSSTTCAKTLAKEHSRLSVQYSQNL